MAFVVLNFTVVEPPERFVPLIVTIVPTPPLVGVKLVIVGPPGGGGGGGGGGGVEVAAVGEAEAVGLRRP